METIPTPYPVDVTPVTGRTENEIFKNITAVINRFEKENPDKEIMIFSFNKTCEAFAAEILKTEENNLPERNQSDNAYKYDEHKIMGAIKKLRERKIYINDEKNVSMFEIKAILKKINNLGLVIMNSCPAIIMHKQYRESCFDESMNGKHFLKLMAADLKVPVVLSFPHWCWNILE
jgi:replicative DNA helicase